MNKKERLTTKIFDFKIWYFFPRNFEGFKFLQKDATNTTYMVNKLACIFDKKVKNATTYKALFHLKNTKLGNAQRKLHTLYKQNMIFYEQFCFQFLY